VNQLTFLNDIKISNICERKANFFQFKKFLGDLLGKELRRNLNEALPGENLSEYDDSYGLIRSRSSTCEQTSLVCRFVFLQGANKD